MASQIYENEVPEETPATTWAPGLAVAQAAAQLLEELGGMRHFKLSYDGGASLGRRWKSRRLSCSEVELL